MLKKKHFTFLHLPDAAGISNRRQDGVRGDHPAIMPYAFAPTTDRECATVLGCTPACIMAAGYTSKNTELRPPRPLDKTLLTASERGSAPPSVTWVMLGMLVVVPREVGDAPTVLVDRIREGLLVRCEATKQSH